MMMSHTQQYTCVGHHCSHARTSDLQLVVEPSFSLVAVVVSFSSSFCCWWLKPKHALVCNNLKMPQNNLNPLRFAQR
eukprot:m.284622 g.284622  ORF g.284622 m.284622 type:complete len:77 (+) comp15766_c0_seq3:1287-1517(+)